MAVFNLFNAADSDTDYYDASRLPGEPADGVNDIHFHPTLPPTAPIGLIVGFRPHAATGNLQRCETSADGRSFDK